MQQQAVSNDAIEAIVGDVFPEEGKRYATAYPKETSERLTKETSITFSLSVWPKGESLPQKGQCVELSNVCQFAKGWRAQKASPIKAGTSSSTPSMEQP